MVLAILLVAGAAAQEASNERGDLFGSGYFGEPAALAGCVSRLGVDVKDDGTLEWEWLHFYTGEGQVWRVVGFPGIGLWKFVQMEFFYAPDGRLLRRSWDGDGDRSPDRVVLYRYEGDELVQVDDQLPEKTAHTWLTWEDGELASIAVDRDGDLVADDTTERRFEGGRLVAAGTDSDGDGEWDGVSTYTYDARGRPLTQEADFDADGVVDQVDEAVWDDAGRVVEKRKDLGRDGTVDVRTRVDWRCPARSGG